MMTTLLLAATVVAHSAELELAAKLPEIFAKSAAHYKALDAAATPLMTNATGEVCSPRGWHKWKTGRDELDMRSIYDWTSGHYPGALWYLYEATGDGFFKDRAVVWTEILAPIVKVTSNHDVGFMTYCSYGNARRILKTTRYDALLLEAASSLSQRYNADLGLIRSWGPLDEKKDFRVIPDNLMNLELLEWAAGQTNVAIRGTGEAITFDEMAENHADVTMRHQFRPDGGCRHVVDYDQVTKRVKTILRGQGASCETAWSRGQSWAVYGYTMMYRATGYIRYLDFAKKLADYAMNHANMPADGIPYWDYGAPGEERDSSAGAILASALMELSTYVDAADRARYRAFAVKELLALASPAYFSAGGEVGHFLLKHGVGHKPGGSEVDTPLNYGDYYFLEALLRFRGIRARDAACRKALEALPQTAKLPADEYLWRCWREDAPTPERMRARAEKVLVEPIPETTDEFYEEFLTTGNRTHYQDRYYKRLKNLDTLVLAENNEKKGRYLARIEDYLAAIFAMKSWLLPAHDIHMWWDGSRETYRGIWISTDLLSTDVGARLACIVQLLGDRLKPETVARIKAECERRVFGPVRREGTVACFEGTAPEGVRNRCLWWMNGRNNWTSVCWDGITCAALGLIDDPTDRAFFVTGADICAGRYLERAFETDGYCSEGMSYWNYGYGQHLKTGRMLNRLTEGKFDFFRRPKERLVAAYGRACTLRKGVAPAFADGVGAPNVRFLGLVDEFWQDLPKTYPPVSEFPDGQVWLARAAKGLSVAFKGGHNAEHHNHNDVGSYYLMCDDKVVTGDPGGEVYTARTFSDKRYDSKVINSYGHPVPVIGGKLQSTGRAFAAKVLSKTVTDDHLEVCLDLTAVYEVPTLKKLTRTFVYDRAAQTFTVKDEVSFTEPTTFEEAYTTFEGEKFAQPNVRINVLSGGETETSVERIDNPGQLSPDRHAIRFVRPVTAASISLVFTP